MTAFTFMTEKFGGVQRGNNYRANCPECNKKQTLSWAQAHPHAFHCFACGYNGNAFTLGFRDQEKKPTTTEEAMTIEGFKARRRAKGGAFAKESRHRLSDQVVAEFDLRVRQANGKNGRPLLQIPFTNADGETVKYLTTFSKPWLSPTAAFKPKDFWLNLHRLPKNKAGQVVYVLAGEWDLFAFWEHTGVHGISPANGEGSKPRIEDTDIFAGKTVIFLYDNDAAGRKGSKQIASLILRHQKKVRVKCVNLAALGCPGGEDIDYFFANGGTKDRLADLVKNTPDFTDSTPEDVFRLINTLPERGIPRPVNSVSDMSADVLETIWRAGALPENQKRKVFEQLAQEEGIRPDQMRLLSARVRYYENELATMIFFAFDDYLSRAFRENHIRAQATGSGLYERNYYRYENGVYRALTADQRRRLVNNIARLICSADSRMNLSRVRKQLDEDLTHRLDNLPDEVFDDHPGIINFRNGLYDLEKGLLIEHTPEHLSTFQLAIEYHQGRPCPWFTQALETWFEDDQVRREFLKLCFYAITGNRAQHIAAFFYGEGGDGKGEAVKILKSLVGEDRTSAIGLEDLDDPFMAAGLFGKWLNIADEVNRKTHLNDGKFKKVTGGSTMTSNVKYGQPITFEPKALWVIIANSVFSSSDNSRGFNRRIKFIVFRQVPTDKKVENFFSTKLKPELSAIADYILTEGRRLYEEEGFRETEAEQAIKDDLARGHSVNAFWQDVFTDYVDGQNEITISRPAPAGQFDGWEYIDPHAFFERYKQHCKETGSHSSSYQNFVRDSRNIVERLLNAAPGKGAQPVKVQRGKIRVRTDQLKPATSTRVMLVNRNVASLLNPPKKDTQETGASLAKLWVSTPPS